MLRKIERCEICEKPIKEGGVNHIGLEFSQNLSQYNDSDFQICDECADNVSALILLLRSKIQ